MWAAKVIAQLMAFSDPREQLRAIVDGYKAYAIDETFEGGSFFVNLAAEMDDQHDGFRRLFTADAPADAMASLVVATLTGTMPLAKSPRRCFNERAARLGRVLASYETRTTTQERA